jgi:hypothetical protein
MNRGVFILCAGVLAFAVYGCVPPPPPAPPPPGGTLLSASSVTAFDATAFDACMNNFAANKVRLISFDPTTQLGDPPSGDPIGDTPAGNAMAADLKAAFAIAPGSFRAQLCQLTGVFINTINCNGTKCPVATSWGLRDSTQRNSLNDNKYIAISAALFDGRAEALSHRKFAQFLFDNLLGWPAADTTRPQHLASGLNSSNSRAMVLLDALAHEYGHVLWNTTNNPGRAPVFNPLGFCSPTNFFSAWYSMPNSVVAGWRAFGTYNGNEPAHAPGAGAEIKDIVAAIPTDLYTGNASRYTHDFYAPGSPWASLFAAFSPEEDFVETFKLAVLTKAQPPLAHNFVFFERVNGGTYEDVPGTLNQRPVLQAKLACFNVQ